MDAREYFTLMGHGSSLVEDRKSRFIGRAKHVSDEQDAYEFLDSVKKSERGAAHNVYAFCIGKDAEIMRSSDDGEPSGTSGRPCLEAIRGRGLTDCMVVVTRYFGGTLLGTGGLVRAYSSAARDAIEDAGVGKMTRYLRYSLNMGYAEWNRLSGLQDRWDLKDLNVEYGEIVELSFMVRADRSEGCMKEITDTLSGRADAKEDGEHFLLEKV
ncbi:MAG TPA: YigZ family protein [Bacillota bacterium]|nr:YigZ family protein [Bacillota bacterium]